MTNNKKPEPKKVFDVMRPGKAPASATSRPVIARHRSSIKDQDVSLGLGTERRLLDPDNNVKLAPVAPSAADTNTAPPEASIQVPTAPPLPQQPPEATPETPQPAEEDAEVKTPKDDAQPYPPRPAAEAPDQSPPGPPEHVEEEMGKTAVDSSLSSGGDEPQKLLPVQSEPLHMDMPDAFKPGKVVVSHHNKAHTIWLELLAVLAVLLLLAAIANFLLDAEVLKTDLNIPHTNIFKT